METVYGDDEDWVPQVVLESPAANTLTEEHTLTNEQIENLIANYDGYGEDENFAENDYDDEYYYEDDDGVPAQGQVSSKGGNSVTSSAKTYQPKQHSIDKMLGKMNFSHGAVGELARSINETETSRAKHTGRDDRATTEQVLDPRTRMILYKLLNQNFVSEINGCVSTGKEANVYYARGPEAEYAVKIYKTSILVFKDRDKYVSGEFRWRHGYSRSNPRKMVKVWAEKEMRNLKRPSPRLKDAQLSSEKLSSLFVELIKMMRVMYQKCHLVHGDLSEYNILYHQSKLYIIDVSQSVEHDHPSASEFLRIDCRNVCDYFGRQGVMVPTVRVLYDFITKDTIDDNKVDKHIADLLEDAAHRPKEKTAEEEIDEAVFMNSFIPRSLQEVRHYEQDYEDMRAGKVDVALAQALSTLAPQDEGTNQNSQSQEEESEESGEEHSASEEDEEEDAEDDGDDEDATDEDEEREAKLKRKAESREEARKCKEEEKKKQKENKKLVKEEKREKRKTKIPKHVKRRQKKLAKQGGKK